VFVHILSTPLIAPQKTSPVLFIQLTEALMGASLNVGLVSALRDGRIYDLILSLMYHTVSPHVRSAGETHSVCSGHRLCY